MSANSDVIKEERGRLCLTRNEGQIVVLGDDIFVKVDNIRGRQVRLVIVAPKELSVHRLEIWNKIQEEKEDVR